MQEAIRVTYYQFFAQLTEWLDEAVLYRYQAEIFSAYAAGQKPGQVANAIDEANYGCVSIDPE